MNCKTQKKFCMNKNLIFLLIILSLFSCKKEEVVIKDSGHISAFANNVEWKSEAYNNPYIEIDKTGGGSSMYLVWKLQNWITEANPGTKMYISMFYPITIGKYYFNNDGHSLPSKGVGVFIQGWEKSGSIIDYYSISGYVEITSINNDYVEGNFNFKAKDISNHTLEMTNGVFKAYIITYAS